MMNTTPNSHVDVCRYLTEHGFDLSERVESESAGHVESAKKGTVFSLQAFSTSTEHVHFEVFQKCSYLLKQLELLKNTACSVFSDAERSVFLYGVLCILLESFKVASPSFSSLESRELGILLERPVSVTRDCFLVGIFIEKVGNSPQMITVKFCKDGKVFCVNENGTILQ